MSRKYESRLPDDIRFMLAMARTNREYLMLIINPVLKQAERMLKGTLDPSFWEIYLELVEEFYGNKSYVKDEKLMAVSYEGALFVGRLMLKTSEEFEANGAKLLDQLGTDFVSKALDEAKKPA